ncbi:MAG: type 1 glutamine amidotransferase domain-containing protein [bacterium]
MKLEGTRVAYLVESGFEDLEFWVPVMRLREEGVNVKVVGTGKSEYKGKHGLTATADLQAEEARAEEFDGCVIPGGWAPDRLRCDENVIELVRNLNSKNKIIGSICHAGQVLISARIVEGQRATGTTAIKDDLQNAGATWTDKPAFREDNLVWGRVVKDIPHFCRELIRALEGI